MRRLWLFPLAGILGGCLSALPPATETETVPEPGELLVRAGEEPFSLLPEVDFRSATEGASPEPSISYSLLDGLVPQDLAQAEFFSEELPDPETLDDNLLLSGADETPPENEGQTVTAEISFDFPVVENDKVRYFIDYYTGRGRKVFTRWLERSSRYLPLMREIFAEEGLPQDLAYLAMVESGFNTRAYSWAHAVGPWQFIKSTARLHGLESNWWFDERRDFEKSTHAAARFLKDLHRRFDDWYLAVAAYNAGPGKIARAVRKYDSRDFWEISRGRYLQVETKHYVPKLMAVMLIAKEPEKYGFAELEYLEPMEYEKVNVPTATDLEVVARLCEVDYEAIKELNPELKRWCTPPGEKDYELRVPAGSREQFEERYARLPEEDRANYQRHKVQPGDTLSALAKRYRIRVNDIVALNGIRNPRALRVGSNLILPLKKGYSRLPVEELRDDYVRTRRRTYQVRKGDSLWSIARRFDVTEKQLRVWNRLGWSNVIRPGQTLIVSANAAASRSRSSKRSAGPARKIVYQVKPGDTLWGIGRRFDVATREIIGWNNLSADQILRPGDKLTLLVHDDQRG